MAVSTEQLESPWGTTPDGEVKAVTLKSVTAAILIVLFSIWWDEWTPFYMAASNISRSHFPLAFFFPLLVLSIWNLIVRRLNPGWELSRAEMVVVLGIGLVAISVPYDGITGHLIGVLAGVFYFATPENGWALFLHDYVPEWLAPQNTGSAMEWFFEGTPLYGKAVLSVWVTPILWWSLFLASVTFALFALVVILRRQWIENERLTYPLVQVGQILTETDSEGRLAGVFRSPLFWIAFGLVMFIKLWNMGSYFTPVFTVIPIEGGQFQLYPDFPRLIRRVSFWAVGFGYFARLDVLLSVWVFVLLAAFEVFLFNRFGYTQGAADIQWLSEALGWQSVGALMFLAGWSLWMARKHLGYVLRKALNPKCEFEYSGELLSYRTAVFGLFSSLLFAGAWLCAAGMEFWVVLTFLPISLLMYLGLSKVIAELGLVYAYYGVQPRDFVLKLWGTPKLGSSSVTILGFMRAIDSTGKGLMMPAFTQAVKAVDRVVKPRRIALMIWVAVGLTYILSISDTLYLGYTHGAYNLGNMGLKNAAPGTFNKAINAFSNTISVGCKGFAMWAGICVAVMALLTLVR